MDYIGGGFGSKFSPGAWAEIGAILSQKAGGKPVKRITGLKSQLVQDNGKAVALQIPAHLLKRDDYVVTLYGLRTNGPAEPVDSYAFSVSR